MVPFERLGASSILHQFRDKARYWSQIVIFSYPLAFGAPLGGPRRNIDILFGTEKLTTGWCKNFEDMYNRLPACDRWTDGRTDILPRHNPCYAYALRVKTDVVTINMFTNNDGHICYQDDVIQLSISTCVHTTSTLIFAAHCYA